jgi:3-dehydroquinate synthetase
MMPTAHAFLTLNLDLGEKSYPIYIGQNLLNQKALLFKHILGKQVMIVTNTTVAPLYLAKVRALLSAFTVAEVMQNDKFCRIGDFMKYSHSKAMAVLHKIVKLVKNGVLMIIHIYAKTFIMHIFFLRHRP